jgi:hypothetical protein
MIDFQRPPAMAAVFFEEDQGRDICRVFFLTSGLSQIKANALRG